MEGRHLDKRFVCLICNKGYVMEHWWLGHINNVHNGYLSDNDFTDKNNVTKSEAKVKKILKPSSKSLRFGTRTLDNENGFRRVGNIKI
jgi:hypothetical protein